MLYLVKGEQASDEIESESSQDPTWLLHSYFLACLLKCLLHVLLNATTLKDYLDLFERDILSLQLILEALQ